MINRSLNRPDLLTLDSPNLPSFTIIPDYRAHRQVASVERTLLPIVTDGRHDSPEGGLKLTARKIIKRVGGFPHLSRLSALVPGGRTDGYTLVI